MISASSAVFLICSGVRTGSRRNGSEGEGEEEEEEEEGEEEGEEEEGEGGVRGEEGSLVCMGQDVGDFRNDDLFCCEFDGFGRAGDAEDYAAFVDAGCGTGKDDSVSDLGIAFLTEEFTESVHGFYEEGGDRFDGAVIMGKTCAAVHDDAVGLIQGRENCGSDV